MVQPSYRDMENMNGETPAIIFTKEHKQLLEEGKKWMIETAKSCMLIAILIAVVVFASSFNVPGGNNNATGRPLLLNERFFLVYSVSEATAMGCSLISVLMFLSILTSRYAEIDFLHALPFRLMIGTTTLFISLSAMMVAFCTTFVLFNGHGFLRGALLFGSFACVALVFILLKYPLVLDILLPICRSQSLFRSPKRLL